MKRSGADEVVCLRSFATALLAQTATKRGLRDVFEDLFETRVGSQEIYFDELPLQTIATYQTFDRTVRHYHSQACGRIPLGIRRENKTLLNPTGHDARLRSGDQLVVMATKQS